MSRGDPKTREMMGDLNLPCSGCQPLPSGVVRLLCQTASPTAGRVGSGPEKVHTVYTPQNTCTLFCRPWAPDTYLEMYSFCATPFPTEGAYLSTGDSLGTWCTWRGPELPSSAWSTPSTLHLPELPFFPEQTYAFFFLTTFLHYPPHVEEAAMWINPKALYE